MSRRVLVAGIGNIFLCDDGFGVEVVNHLATRALPPGVRVADFGIRGVHLAYELLDGYDCLILVDAVSMDEAPGTVTVIEPEAPGSQSGGDDDRVIDSHNMSPEIVLATLARLGGRVERIYVVGCQPASLAEGMGLTPPVAAAVEGAVEMCIQLIAEIVQTVGKGTSK